MDSKEKASIDLSSKEADAECKHKEWQEEALQILIQQSKTYNMHVISSAVDVGHRKFLYSLFNTRYQHLGNKRQEIVNK